jgi:hypothetical protein
MTRLLDPDLRRRMGERSKEIVEEYIDPGAAIEGFRRAIRMALKMRKRRARR